MSFALEFPEELLDALAERVAEKVAARVAGGGSPWLTTVEAIEYTRLPEGTFRKWAASGRLPSHGGRRKLFHRVELDAALGYALPGSSSVETTGGVRRAA